MKALFIILPLAVLLAMIIWGGIVIYRAYNYEWTKGRKVSTIIASVFSFAMIVVLSLVPASIHQVDAGQVAVVKVWGDAKEVRTAGIHFDLWISHKYEIYDAKVQQTIETTQAYSNDGQTMDIEIVIQYQIQQENTLTIARNYGGLEMLESRIGTVAIEKTKSVLSQKSAMKII